MEERNFTDLEFCKNRVFLLFSVYGVLASISICFSPVEMKLREHVAIYKRAAFDVTWRCIVKTHFG